MSKLEELIAELCPDGVEYNTLGNIAEVGTGSSNGNESDENGMYPFFVRSQLIKAKNTYEYDEEAIIIPGEGGVGDIFHYINGKYALHQRVYRIHFLKKTVDVRFAYHYMKAHFKQFIMRKAVSATVASIRKPMIEQFTIPVPPLPVQSEIVRILDNFTGLTAELTAELTKELTTRKKQYEYYRNELLTFEKSTPRIRLGDICTVITKGTTPKSYKSSGIAFVKTEAFDGSRIVSEKLSYVDEETHLGFLKRSILKADDILITIAGATIGKCAMVPANILPANTNQALAIIRIADGNSKKYVMHLLQSNHMKKYMQSNIKGSAQPNLNLKQLNDFIIPLPSVEEQERIVAILERFESICNDISTDLPAEIEARRKQYEYYRDKLLTFKDIS